MAFGERLRFFRKFRNMTQKYLGVRMGFTPRTADVRMAQYEAGIRKPKADLVERFAVALEVSPNALNVPDIDTYLGLMHTLFALEDIYGLKIDKLDGELCLRLDKSREKTYSSLFDPFNAWQKEAEKYRKGEISREEYDRWRYIYPEVEVQRTRDALDELKKRGIE